MRTARAFRASPWAAVRLLLLLGVLLIPALPALATDECEGASPDNPCVSLHSGLVRLGPDHTESQRLTCPASHPWGWSMDYTRDSAAVSVLHWFVIEASPNYMSWTATNWSPSTDHEVTVYIGCVVSSGSDCSPWCPRNSSDRPGSPTYRPPAAR